MCVCGTVPQVTCAWHVCSRREPQAYCYYILPRHLCVASARTVCTVCVSTSLLAGGEGGEVPGRGPRLALQQRLQQRLQAARQQCHACSRVRGASPNNPMRPCADQRQQRRPHTRLLPQLTPACTPQPPRACMCVRASAHAHVRVAVSARQSSGFTGLTGFRATLSIEVHIVPHEGLRVKGYGI